MKFLKKHRFKLIITLIVISALYLLWFVKQQKIYEQAPWLIPPRQNYDQKQSLTDEQKKQYETEVKKYDDLIKNFKTWTGEQEINLWNGIKWMAIVEKRPQISWYIDKSRNLEYIGRYTEAIETLIAVFKRYDKDELVWNNLSVLYENVGEYKRAARILEKLIETYPDNKKTYIERIINLYIQAEDAKNAWKWYFEYENNWWVRNLDLINTIRVIEGKDPIKELR